MLVPQIEFLYYALNMEGVAQKGSLLPAYIRKQIIILKLINAKANSSFLLDKNKNQLKLLFSTLVPPNFWN